MGLNRTARGIVLVPSLLLGGAFLATAAWLDGPAAANRPLALGLGTLLIAAGALTQLLPDDSREPEARDSRGGSSKPSHSPPSSDRRNT
ncbi:MAG: GIVxVP protein [Cyanobium sp.]